MRRITAALLLLITVLFLCACSAQNSNIQTDIQNETTGSSMELPDVATVYDAIQSVFQIDGQMHISLSYISGSVHGPYHIYAMGSNYQTFGGSVLTPLAGAPDVSSANSWLTITSADQSVQLRLYRTEPCVIQYETQNQEWFFEADAHGSENLEYLLLHEYAPIERYALGRICFDFAGEGEDVIKHFGETVYPAWMQEQAIPIADSYDFLECEVKDVKSNCVLGIVSYAIKPNSAHERFAMQYGELQKSGTYENWYLVHETVVLEQQSNGQWTRVNENDYYAANTSYEAYDPTAVKDTGNRAAAFLNDLPSLLKDAQNHSDPEKRLISVSELFLKATTAVPLSGSLDFDWSVFLTADAPEHIGIRSLFSELIQRKDASGYFLGELDSNFTPNLIHIQGEQAIVAHYQIQLYFVNENGHWKLDDVVRPFAGS